MKVGVWPESAEEHNRLTHRFAHDGTIPCNAICEGWPESGAPAASVDFELFTFEGGQLNRLNGQPYLILRGACRTLPFHQDLMELATACPEIEFVWLLSTTSLARWTDLWTYAQQSSLAASNPGAHAKPLDRFLAESGAADLEARQISGIQHIFPNWSLWLDADDSLGEPWLFPRHAAVLSPTEYPRLYDTVNET
ncbi:hypothetical protein JW848_06765 [Candidatus Bipolaricaulota bacterium]|nr:hypothetical protein [Candidatus Bipolaricaulota bacterium]